MASVTVNARDRIQHGIIFELAKEKVQKCVFKGGTMLRVCALPQYRMSEDLDFDVISPFIPLDLLQSLDSVSKRISESIEVDLFLGYSNILGIHYIGWGNGIENEEYIKLDIGLASKKHLRDRVELLKVQPNYSEFRNSDRILCYSLEHVAATKFHCLASRVKGRDIYDIWRLAKLPNIVEAGWHIYLTDKELRTNLQPQELADNLKELSSTFVAEWEADVSTLLIPYHHKPLDIIENVILIIQNLQKKKV